MTPEDSKKVGGSDVSAVLGLSRYGGPLSVYLRVVDGVEREGNEHTRRGSGLESYVLDTYALTHDIVDRDIHVFGLREHERATVDAVADDGKCLIPVEAKTAMWRVMDHWGAPGTDEVPEEYLLQCQWYAGSMRQDPALGSDMGDVIHVPALVGGEYGLWVVRYDAELYQGLREGVARFWRDHVVPRRPPEPTALSNDAEAIRKRYAKPSRPVLRWEELTDEQRETVRAWQTQKRCRELEESSEEEFAQRVRLLLGDHEGLIGLPDGSRVDWRKNKSTTKCDWEGVARDTMTAVRYGKIITEDGLHAFARNNTTTTDGARPLVLRQEKKR